MNLVLLASLGGVTVESNDEHKRDKAVKVHAWTRWKFEFSTNSMSVALVMHETMPAATEGILVLGLQISAVKVAVTMAAILLDETSGNYHSTSGG